MLEHPQDEESYGPCTALATLDEKDNKVPFGMYDIGDRVTVPEDFTGFDDARPGIITYMLGNSKADVVITEEGDPPTHGDSGHTYHTVRVPLECLEKGY